MQQYNSSKAESNQAKFSENTLEDFSNSFQIDLIFKRYNQRITSNEINYYLLHYLQCRQEISDQQFQREYLKENCQSQQLFSGIIENEDQIRIEKNEEIIQKLFQYYL